ncbi:hypothetical protein WMY93_002612 [Mugilogobius chulae]|uniref:Uncharacterized protein n=1 Tax=Mugilogobius chulae TaxID=88201 RepID=A0AAW0Q058_9GOBI
MGFSLTDWLQNLSVSVTSIPVRCERILNSLSLSQACTLSLHQDELSKMEDARAVVREEREMPPLVNSHGTYISVSFEFCALDAKLGPGDCVCCELPVNVQGGGYPDVNFRCQTSPITPIAGFSSKQPGQICALCLSALIDWMSLLPVECGRSSAVSQRRGCQAGAWLQPSD